MEPTFSSTPRGHAASHDRATVLARRTVCERATLFALGAGLLLLAVWAAWPGFAAAAVNPNPPTTPVKLVFIHHSTGEAWLADDHGGLGLALRDNNYFVSDTNYGWGPDSIGDSTDIGQWWTWFRSPSAPTYMAALYAESGQNCSYSRLADDPGGANEVVMFKSCFPNSDLLGSATATPPPIASNPLKGESAGGDDFTVANAKGIYMDILNYFAAHQEKLFVAIVAPPIQNPQIPADGRAMANWLVNDWLATYPYHNVFVFDFYDVLTSKTGGGASDVGLETGNHHRIWNGAVQHTTDQGVDHLMYPSDGDDHPNAAGDQKATAEFVPLLNNAYNAWKAIPAPLSITLTAPNGGESWTRLVSHTFTWKLNQAVSSGSFRVYLKNAAGTYFLQTTTNIPAVAGQTSYAFAKTISAAAASGYVARVQYYDAGGMAGAKDDSDAAFSIVEPPLAVTVTAPNGGESWTRNASHSFTWTLNHAVSSGSFRVYLRNSTGTYYLQTTTNIPAVAGQTSYSFPKVISVAAGSGYIARVQYYDAGGTAGAKDDSDASFSIVEPPLAVTVTAPNGGESWTRLVSHSFTWKLNHAVSSGSFRVYLKNSAGTYFLQTTSNIPAVAGQTSYAFAKTISVAAGSGYVARVQYYDAGGTTGAKDDSDAPFTITP